MKNIFYILLFVSVIPFACQGPQGEVGLNSLINITQEPPGDNCEFGGIKIETGPDNNQDDELSLDEVSTVEFICNGSDAFMDQVVTIYLGSEIGAASNSSPNLEYTNEVLFNISDYANIDSVVFILTGVFAYENTIGTFELYDITNDKVIPNSKIITDEGPFGNNFFGGYELPSNNLFYSANLVNSFPTEPIQLGIRTTTTFSDVWAHKATMILYRK